MTTFRPSTPQDFTFAYYESHMRRNPDIGGLDRGTLARYTVYSRRNPVVTLTAAATAALLGVGISGVGIGGTYAAMGVSSGAQSVASRKNAEETAQVALNSLNNDKYFSTAQSLLTWSAQNYPQSPVFGATSTELTELKGAISFASLAMLFPLGSRYRSKLRNEATSYYNKATAFWSFDSEDVSSITAKAQAIIEILLETVESAAAAGELTSEQAAGFKYYLMLWNINYTPRAIQKNQDQEEARKSTGHAGDVLAETASGLDLFIQKGKCVAGVGDCPPNYDPWGTRAILIGIAAVTGTVVVLHYAKPWGEALAEHMRMKRERQYRRSED